jgi:hypothetical protein
VVELALESGRRSAAVLPGLDMMELVLLDAVEVVDFFSSSLALTLGRLRWLEAEVAEVAVARRTVPGAPGRVGGLLKPPGARVLDAVLAVLEVVVPGRRVVVVPAGRFTRGLESPFALVEASGEVGVELLGLETSGAVSATGDPTDSACSAGGTSSCWTTSKLSVSDMT